MTISVSYIDQRATGVFTDYKALQLLYNYFNGTSPNWEIKAVSNTTLPNGVAAGNFVIKPKGASAPNIVFAHNGAPGTGNKMAVSAAACAADDGIMVAASTSGALTDLNAVPAGFSQYTSDFFGCNGSGGNYFSGIRIVEDDSKQWLGLFRKNYTTVTSSSDVQRFAYVGGGVAGYMTDRWACNVTGFVVLGGVFATTTSGWSSTSTTNEQGIYELAQGSWYLMGALFNDKKASLTGRGQCLGTGIGRGDALAPVVLFSYNSGGMQKSPAIGALPGVYKRLIGSTMAGAYWYDSAGNIIGMETGIEYTASYASMTVLADDGTVPY